MSSKEIQKYKLNWQSFVKEDMDPQRSPKSMCLSRDSRFASQSHAIHPTSRHPEETRMKCDIPSLAEPLVVRPFWRARGGIAAIVCHTLKNHRATG